MGYYINKLPNGESLPSNGKADKILSSIEGAEEIKQPSQWEEDIVCVVDNGPFEAAAYAFCPEELNVFARPDGRPKRWLKVPNAKSIAN